MFLLLKEGTMTMTMTKVDVYRNLHKPGYFTVKSRERHNYGLKIGEGPTLFIRNPRFVVQKGGRERCIKQGQRNVHAFVRGELDLESGFEEFLLTQGVNSLSVQEVTYNPFKWNSFVLKTTEKAVFSAPWCLTFGKGVCIPNGQGSSDPSSAKCSRKKAQ